MKWQFQLKDFCAWTLWVEITFLCLIHQPAWVCHLTCSCWINSWFIQNFLFQSQQRRHTRTCMVEIIIELLTTQMFLRCFFHWGPKKATSSPVWPWRGDGAYDGPWNDHRPLSTNTQRNFLLNFSTQRRNFAIWLSMKEALRNSTFSALSRKREWRCAI